MGSSPTQLPVAAVPDVADASAKAVAGPSGAGEVGGHPAEEQPPEQLAEGDAVNQGERASVSGSSVLSLGRGTVTML